MLDVLENEVYTRIFDILWAGWDESRIENAVDCTGKVTDAQLQQWREDQEQLELDTMREVINEHYPAAGKNPVIHTFFEDYWKLKRQYENETTNQGLQILEMENRLKRSAQANKGLSLQIQGLQYQIAGLQSVGDADTIGLFPAMPGAYLENSILAYSSLPESEGNDMAKTRIKRRIEINGEERWITADTEQEYFEKIKKLFSNGDAPTQPKEKHNFKEFATNWFEVFNKPNVEEVSARTNERQLKKYLFPAFGQKNIEDITTEDFQKLFNEMGSEKALETKKKVKNVANMIFQYAIETKIVSFNPLKSVTLKITGQKSKKTPAYSVQEMTFFANSIDEIRNPRDKAWFAIHVFHAVRPEECLGLKNKDIIRNGNGAIMNICGTVTHPDRNKPVYKEKLKTEASNRKMQVSPAALPYIPKGKPEEFVIGGENPLSCTQVKKMCERIAKDIGYNGKITPERFRTSVASDLYQATKDKKLLQNALGHAKYSETAMNHYIECRQGLEDTGTIIANVYKAQKQVM